MREPVPPSFADDTRVQRGVLSADDCSSLQEDLQLIYSWAENVNMTFNSDKFECLRYWAEPDKAPPFQYLAPDNQPIEVKSDLRDLGSGFQATSVSASTSRTL